MPRTPRRSAPPGPRWCGRSPSTTRSLDLGRSTPRRRSRAPPPSRRRGRRPGRLVRPGRPPAWLDTVRRQRGSTGSAPARPSRRRPRLDADRSPATTSTTGSRCSSSPATTRSRPARSSSSRCGWCRPHIRRIAGHLGIAEATAAARLTRAKSRWPGRAASSPCPTARPGQHGCRSSLACVAGLLTVGQRDVSRPPTHRRPGSRRADPRRGAGGRVPEDPEVLGLRAVCRLALARRPGRVRDGVALPLDEVDRSAWDPRCCHRRPGRRQDRPRGPALAPSPPGRFALEAAISGVHAAAPSTARTDWDRLALLYDALVEVWPSPAVEVARLVVTGRPAAMRDGTATSRRRARLEAWSPTVRRTPLATRGSRWPTWRTAPAGRRGRRPLPRAGGRDAGRARCGSSAAGTPGSRRPPSAHCGDHRLGQHRRLVNIGQWPVGRSTIS